MFVIRSTEMMYRLLFGTNMPYTLAYLCHLVAAAPLLKQKVPVAASLRVIGLVVDCFNAATVVGEQVGDLAGFFGDLLQHSANDGDAFDCVAAEFAVAVGLESVVDRANG